MSITPFSQGSGNLDAPDELDELILNQQRMLVKAQVLLKQKMEARMAAAELNAKALNARVQVLEGGYKLITVNQLDTMVGADWSEKEKNKIGVSLAQLVRSKGLKPTKVAHPTLPGGVNGYEPELVVEWLNREGYQIPEQLRYVG